MISLIFIAFGALLLGLGVVAVIAVTNTRPHAGQPAPHLPFRRLLLLGTGGVLLLLVGMSGPFVEVPAGSVGVVTNFRPGAAGDPNAAPSPSAPP